MKKIVIFILIIFCTFIVTEDVCKADDVIDDFKSRLSDMKTEILMKHLDVVKAMSQVVLQRDLESLEIQYRGYVPAEVKRKTYLAHDALNNADKEFEVVLARMKSLKTEIVQYYKGQTPNELKKMLADLFKLWEEKFIENSNKKIEYLKKQISK